MYAVINFSTIHLYCNNKNARYCLLKALWHLSLKCCSAFAQSIAPRREIVFLSALVETCIKWFCLIAYLVL